MTTRLVTAIVLLALLGYGFLEAVPLLSGPSLAIASPIHGASIQDGILDVTGAAKRITTLTLNGTPLLTDETGAFSRTLVLPRGGAILTFVATDRFGRSVTKQESVYVP